MSRAATSRSNTAGPRGEMNGCPSSRPTWCGGARWRSRRSAVTIRPSPQGSDANHSHRLHKRRRPPIKVGLVASLERPGALVTGVSWFAAESVSKLMQFLGKLVPNIARAVLLVNPASPELAGQKETAQQAARALGWQLQVTEARSEQEIDTAFADAKRQRADAVIVSADPFFRTRYKQLVAQAARHGLPASYFAREFVMAG